MHPVRESKVTAAFTPLQSARVYPTVKCARVNMMQVSAAGFKSCGHVDDCQYTRADQYVHSN